MLQVINGEQKFEIEDNNNQLSVNNEIFEWDIKHIDGQRYHAIYKSQSFSLELVHFQQDSNEYQIKINGKTISLQVKDKMALLLEKLGISAVSNTKLNELKAPMPGHVLNILVKEGQRVEKGDALLVLEAMKMENVLKATGDGVVSNIKVSQGDNVEKNSQLLTFE